MAEGYYKYNKDAQDKYSQSAFERFLKISKEEEFALDPKKDGDYLVRAMPPWSAEGVFAKGTKVHFRVGLESRTVVCPTVLGEVGCNFCYVHAEIKADERFKLDSAAIRPNFRYVSNMVNMNEAKRVQVWSYGPQIFFPIKKIQDGGQFGDLTDPIEGRDIIINRQVRGKVTDSVYPSPKMTALINPDWLDQIYNLDKVIPDVDEKLVKRLFDSHPWKVYEPNNKNRVISVPNVTVGNDTPGKPPFAAQVEMPKQDVEQPSPTSPTPSSPDDIAARLRAKIAEKQKAQQSA